MQFLLSLFLKIAGLLFSEAKSFIITRLIIAATVVVLFIVGVIALLVYMF